MLYEFVKLTTDFISECKISVYFWFLQGNFPKLMEENPYNMKKSITFAPYLMHKMKKRGVIFLAALACSAAVSGQVEVRTEVQTTSSDGEHTPLWLNANKYGLSSLDKTNGYVRVGAFRDASQDSCRRLRLGAAVDVAVAAGFTSDMVVQQAYGELGFMKGLLTVGSKQQPMELKNQELSTGPQTLGINARPVPSVRLSLPEYWEIPGTRGWLALKGHLSYGLTTDDGWEANFTQRENAYTKHTLLHTKAGYVRIGRKGTPLNVEMGMEMACQFGGKSYQQINSTELSEIKNTVGLKGMWRALIPGGAEATETTYKNTDGNHLGSVLARVNLDYPTWGLSAYADHFFEDHSQMFFFSRNDYGTGERWEQHEGRSYFVYDLRDAMLGLELRLKGLPWLNTVVAEYLYTKYQSGPVYHDHTPHLSDQIAGRDDYYNHFIFACWQHWGQVMGNPLYRSPLYNDDRRIMVEDNRFWAWHVAASGEPLPRLRYRLMCTWQHGFGTYLKPLANPARNMSLLAEAAYSFAPSSTLKGWSVKGALGMDRGKLLGDNLGFQLTLEKVLTIAE